MKSTQEATQLGVYIPMDRRQALAQSQMTRDVALPEQADGAMLFADISGFTPLALALSTHLGPQRGAEELTQQLNQVYEILIAQIHRYRGSVIGFVGDAITCWFPADDGRRATTCALAMQAEMQLLTSVCVADEVTVTFSIKIGIAMGRVHRFRVGNPDIQYIDVLAGTPLRTMSLAEGVARRGEVVLSAATVAALGASLTLVEWRSVTASATPPPLTERYALVSALSAPSSPSPWPDLSPDALAFTSVYPWVLPAAYERLRDPQEPFMAELRPAVSLFLRFGGLDYDCDPQAGQKLDAYIQWVQQVAQQYRGSLIQLTVGDKGSFLYIVFGAPVSHDADAVYAVLAALDLIAPPDALNFIHSTQIGVALGLARTGAYGSVTRRAYGVIGDAVMLAARLMSVAPRGGIRCAYSVYRQTRHYIAFEDLPPVRVKGRADWVRVYRPLPNTHHASPDIEPGATFVGRAAELAQLTASFEAVVAGHSRIVLLEGEAGIGKSHLLSKITHQIHARGLTYLYGAGQSLAQHIPYHVWRDVFSFYLGLNTADTIEQRRQQVRLVVQQMLPDLYAYVSLLNDVLPFGLAESVETVALAPQLRQYYLRQLLIGLLQVWAKSHPVLLIFEDVHWLDRLSWELLVQAVHALAMRPTPFLLLMVTRPLAAHSVGAQQMVSLQEFVRAYPLAESVLLPDSAVTAAPTAAATLQMNMLFLDPLNLQETVTLVAARLGLSLERFPASLTNLLEARAGGNPFFAEELALALREQDIIQVPDSAGQMACVVDDDLLREWQVLPYTIHGLILSRIDRLSLEQQFTLKIAAVIGQVFDFTLLLLTLEQHTGVAWAELQGHLDRLVALDLIVGQFGEPSTYSFRHNLMQDAVYQTLLFAQRRDLHRTVAETLEVLYVTNLEAQVEILAHHWLCTGLLDKAIPYWVWAGERARRTYANEAAIAHFRKALALLAQVTFADERQCQFRAWYGLGRTYFDLAEMVQTEACLREAIALGAALLLDTETLVRLYHDLGEALWWQNRTEEHVKVGLQAVALVGGATESVTAALANQTLAVGYVSQGDGEKFFELTLRTARFLRQLPYSEDLRSAFVHVIVAYQSQYKMVEAYQWLNALEVRASQHHDLRASAEAHYLWGNLLLQQGRLRKAIVRYQQALVLYVKIKDVKFQSWCLKGLARAYLSLGALRNAAMYAARALETAKIVGDNRYVIAEHELIMGEVALSVGDDEAAHSAFQKAARLFRALHTYADEAHSVYALGCVALTRGLFDVALQHFQAAVSLEIPVDKWGLCMPHLLHGLERAYGEQHTADYHAFCQHLVMHHAMTHPDCTLSQWDWAPAMPDDNFCLRPVTATALDAQVGADGWQWEDPLDDCELLINQGITLRAANGRSLRDANRSAPRLWCARSGDFALQTMALQTMGGETAAEVFPALGGLIVWQNNDNYVYLDWGSFGPQEVRLMAMIEHQQHALGRGWLPAHAASAEVVLRLERRGTQVLALCRAPVADAPWWRVGATEFCFTEGVRVGLYAIGDVERLLYPGAYPHGTAIQFMALSITE